MKKLLNKIKGKRKQPTTQASSSLRITNETVAEHRERILAGGRKFKYPLQYPKHRIVVITTILVVMLLVSLSGVVIWQLYGAQNTSKFIHRITEVLPLPVAQIEDKQVRYSDYLIELRSALHYLSTKEAVNFSSDDGKRQLAYQKRLALNKAIESSYIQKLARINNVSVSDGELNDFIKNELQKNNLGVTQDVYRQVVKDYYDWSFDDYRQSIKHQLLRKKVVAKTDTEGRQAAQSALNRLAEGADFTALAQEVSEDQMSKQSGGDVGFVSVEDQDPSGLIIASKSLQPGQYSNLIEGIDGFYVIRLLESREKEVRFAKLFIVYRTFSNTMVELRKSGNIKEFISIPETVAPTNR